MMRVLLALVMAVATLGCEPKPVDPLSNSEAKPESVAVTSTETKSAESPAAEPRKTEEESQEKPPFADTQVSASDIAVIETSMGTMRVKFLLDKAPNHAKNFVYLAKKGFYDNTKFHRIIKGFMIQGGDPNTKPGGEKNGPPGTGGPGYNVKNEFNDTPHIRGVLSMARSQDPDSAGSQFFIVHEPSNFLDSQYTAFGKLVSGMDVLDKIANVKTLPGDAPEKPVIIKSIKIVKG